MAVMFYFKNDSNQILYSNKTLPSLKTAIKPNVTTMLRILEKKLELLELSEKDYLCCGIHHIPLVNPVFYPTQNGITVLYEKSALAEWLKQSRIDPSGLSQSVTIDQYRVPTPQELFDYVVNVSGYSRDFFIEKYTQGQDEEASSVDDNLLGTPDHTTVEIKKGISAKDKAHYRSCFSLFFRGICGGNHSNESEDLDSSNLNEI